MAKKRVVIVDDTMSIGRFLQIALKTLDNNLDVAVVPSAEEAVLEVGTTQVDLLITDVNLPGISGLDLSRRIHKRFPETKIVLITGMSDISLEQRASEVGAAAYFYKPLDTALFLETSRKLLALGVETKGPSVDTTPTQRQNKIEPVEPPPPIQLDLPGRLTQLQKALSASGVLLMDERGRIAAQVGDIPSVTFEYDWALSLLGVLSASNKVMQTIARDELPRQVMIFPGKTLLLVLAPVGFLGLLLTFTPEKFKHNVTAVYAEIQKTQPELVEILKDMGIGVVDIGGDSAAEIPAVTQGAGDQNPAEAATSSNEDTAATEFANLLFNTASDLPQADAEAFWESASGNEVVDQVNPNMINFDQARKLGLAPE